MFKEQCLNQVNRKVYVYGTIFYQVQLRFMLQAQHLNQVQRKATRK